MPLSNVFVSCKNIFVFQHEEGSVSMFEHLLTENDLWKALNDRNIGEKDIIFIKELIAGPLDNKEVSLWFFFCIQHIYCTFLHS